MSEGSKPGAVKEIIKSGMELGKQRIDKEHLSIKGIEPVTMTEIVINQDERVRNGDTIVEPESLLLNNSESPVGSFLSIESEQSSEEEKKVHDTTMANKVKILKFEDTLADEDYRQFKIIYDSLLLEGQVGNLTKTTLKVVLAQKPPAWLQVIYERLKHLVVSSKTFWKKKGKYMIKGKAKMPKKIKFRLDKKQKRLKVGNSSNPWPKDHTNENNSLEMSRTIKVTKEKAMQEQA